MKLTQVISLLCILMLLSVYSQDIAKKEKIAVLNFGGNAENWIKETITNQLENEIVNLGRFNIINRRSIQAAIEELKINLTGLVSDDQTIKAGEFLAANKLITGQANYCNVSWYMKKVTRMVNGQSKTFNVRIYKAEISLSAKVIEVEKNIVGEGINIIGIGEDVNRNNAVINAINIGVSKFILKMREIYQLEARVIKKDSREIYLNMGKENGIKKDMVFKVIRIEKNILDESSGDAINIENDVGAVYVDKVYPKYCSAKIIRGAYKINKGDYVKESLTEKLKRFSFLGSYAITPVKMKITTSLTDKEITESTYTGISIFADSYNNSNAYELQLGFLKLENLSGIVADFNYRRKYNLLPEFVDLLAGGGIGFITIGQDISDPDSAWKFLDKTSSDRDVRDYSLTLSASLGFRFTFIRLLHPYAEAGWRYSNPLDEWKAEYKTGKTVDGKAEKKKTKIPDEFIKYPSVTLGGFTYRVGLMINL